MAYNFDPGSSEYHSKDASPVSSLPISVCGRFKVDNTPAADEYIFYYGDQSSASDWFTIAVDNFSVSWGIRFWARGDGLTVAYGTNVDDGAWHSYVGTLWDNAGTLTQTLWVDGAFVGTSTNVAASVIANWDRVAVGMIRDSSPSNPFDGDIADVAMWNGQATLAHAASFHAGATPPMLSIAGPRFVVAADS